jgi:hypothetical protein
MFSMPFSLLTLALLALSKFLLLLQSVGSPLIFSFPFSIPVAIVARRAVRIIHGVY